MKPNNENQNQDKNQDQKNERTPDREITPPMQKPEKTEEDNDFTRKENDPIKINPTRKRPNDENQIEENQGINESPADEDADKIDEDGSRRRPDEIVADKTE